MQINGNFNPVSARRARDILGVTNEIDKVSTVLYLKNFVSLQAAVDAAKAIGGATVKIPSAYTVWLNAPINLHSGVGLEGAECPDAKVGLQGSTIRALVPLPCLITQADLTFSVRNISIRNLLLDASENVTVAAIDVAMISSRIMDMVVQGPSYLSEVTGIRQRTPVGGFGWINHICNVRVGGFKVGLDFNGSDSWITGNYLSGNMVDCILDSTGAVVFSGNQVENSGPAPNNEYIGVGLRILNTNTATVGNFVSFLVTNNNFISHGTAIELPDAQPGFHSCCTFASNNFHDIRVRAFYIGANHSNGSIWTSTFRELSVLSNQAMIVWNGIGNTKWKVGPNTFAGHFNPNPTRYLRMPPDTALLDEDVRSKRVVIDAGGFGYKSAACFAAYGSATELGATFAIARFGVAQDAAGYDPGIMFRGINGNTMAIDFRDGEKTQIADGLLMINGTTLVRLRRAGRLALESLPTSPTGLVANDVWRDNSTSPATLRIV